MAKCPNISHPDFVALKDKYGLKYAVYLYDINNQEIPTLEQTQALIKNKRQNDPLFNEALMSTDSELSNFIFNKLQKEYPGIKIFKSKSDFMDFVRKNGGDMNKVDIDVIGHAFKNAIYIDEENAVQSTFFHENAHIYWDALPETDPIKKQLRSLFADQSLSNEEIDELIIKNIGIAGVSLAELELRGNKTERFINLLKSFWAKVKEFLGIASKKDLVNIISNDIWNNKEKFDEKVFVENAVRNMKMNPLNIQQDEQTKAFMNGDEIWTSVTRAINMFSIFNPDEAANAMYDKMLKTKKQNDDDTEIIETLEEREKFVQMVKNQWQRQAEIGTSLHYIANAIVNNFSFEEIKDITVNEKTGSKIGDYFSDEVLERTYTKINNIIQNWIDKGWKIYSEVTVGSSKHKMAGIADIIMEKGDKLGVLDFKSFFEQDKSSFHAGRYLRHPLETIKDTKEEKHQLQVDVYANMLESQENKDVAFTAIIPFVYEMDGEKVSFFDAENSNAKVAQRKPRKSTIKDKHRKNANIVLNHVSKINEARKQIILSDTEIEEEAKKRKIDPEILKEERESIIVLTSKFGDLQSVPVEYIERILGTGVGFMATEMINSLGYEYEEVFGDKDKGFAPMSAKDFILTSLERIKMIEEDGKRYRESDTPYEKPLTEIEFEDIIWKDRITLGIDFGTNKKEEAYKRYLAEKTSLESIYEEMNDVDGIQKMKQNTLDSVYRKVINMVTPEGRNLKTFIENLLVSRLLTEKLRLENKPGYYGYKYATVFLGRTIRYPDHVFSDFTNKFFLKRFNFKNILKIDKKHVLAQLLGTELLNQHRNTVSTSINLNETLQKYIKDTDDNGRVKKPSERKVLKNEDFEDIIYKDKKTGFLYFETPSRARKILEEKYGKEDPRPRNMARYISIVTKVMVENSDLLKSIAKKRQPNIMIPEFQQKKIETFNELSSKNKIHIAKVRRLFEMKEYDNTFITYKGEKKRLIDFKRKIYKRLEEKNSENESISKELEEMEFFDNIASLEYGKSGKKTKRKTVYVVGKQTGRTILKSKNYNASVQEYLTSVIESKRMEKTIPLAEYTKEAYKNAGVKNMTEFLDNEISHKIYKNVDDFMDQTWITGDLPKILIGWTAKKALGLGILSNITNRVMGLHWNLVTHPKSIVLGYYRRFTDFGEKRNVFNKITGIDQYKKLAGIMKSTNIGTVMQDATFSKYKIFSEKINEIAFLPLAATETVNQGELLRGIIHEREYKAYNKKGNPYRVYKDEILDPDTDRSTWPRKKQIEWDKKWKESKLHPDVITENRANEIAAILSEVHGYFGFNKSQWSYYTLGKLVGMFTLSWAQSAFNVMYQEKQTDTTGRVRTGLVNSVILNSKILMYNLFASNEKRKDIIEKLNKKYYQNSGFLTRKEAEIELYKKDRYADPNEYIVAKKEGDKTYYYIPGLHMELSEFEKLLLKKTDKMEIKDRTKISKEEIDIIDRQNMMRLAVMLTLAVTGKLLSNMIGGWDDDIVYGPEYEEGGKKKRSDKPRPLGELTREERIKSDIYSFINKRILMAGEDAWFFLAPNFYGRYFQTPPALQTPVDIVNTGINIVRSMANNEKGYHMNPTQRNSYMEPKYQDQLMNQIPYLAQPYRVGKSVYRFAADKEYHDQIKKRGTKNYINFRNQMISKVSAGIKVSGESKEKLEKAIKKLEDNRELIENAYLEMEILKDFTKSKYWDYEIVRDFYAWVNIYEQELEEELVDEMKKTTISDDDIEEIIKKYNIK
jgi:hypothetical protein